MRVQSGCCVLMVTLKDSRVPLPIFGTPVRAICRTRGEFRFENTFATAFLISGGLLLTSGNVLTTRILNPARMKLDWPFLLQIQTGQSTILQQQILTRCIEILIQLECQLFPIEEILSQSTPILLTLIGRFLSSYRMSRLERMHKKISFV